MTNYRDEEPPEFRDIDEPSGYAPDPVFGGTWSNPPHPAIAYTHGAIDDPLNYQSEADIWQARQARAFAARTAKHLGMDIYQTRAFMREVYKGKDPFYAEVGGVTVSRFGETSIGGVSMSELTYRGFAAAAKEQFGQPYEVTAGRRAEGMWDYMHGGATRAAMLRQGEKWEGGELPDDRLLIGAATYEASAVANFPGLAVSGGEIESGAAEGKFVKRVKTAMHPGLLYFRDAERIQNIVKPQSGQAPIGSRVEAAYILGEGLLPPGQALFDPDVLGPGYRIRPVSIRLPEELPDDWSPTLVEDQRIALEGGWFDIVPGGAIRGNVPDADTIKVETWGIEESWKKYGGKDVRTRTLTVQVGAEYPEVAIKGPFGVKAGGAPFPGMATSFDMMFGDKPVSPALIMEGNEYAQAAESISSTWSKEQWKEAVGTVPERWEPGLSKKVWTHLFKTKQVDLFQWEEPRHIGLVGGERNPQLQALIDGGYAEIMSRKIVDGSIVGIVALQAYAYAGPMRVTAAPSWTTKRHRFSEEDLLKLQKYDPERAEAIRRYSGPRRDAAANLAGAQLAMQGQAPYYTVVPGQEVLERWGEISAQAEVEASLDHPFELREGVEMYGLRGKLMGVLGEVVGEAGISFDLGEMGLGKGPLVLPSPGATMRMLGRGGGVKGAMYGAMPRSYIEVINAMHMLQQDPENKKLREETVGTIERYERHAAEATSSSRFRRSVAGWTAPGIGSGAQAFAGLAPAEVWVPQERLTDMLRQVWGNKDFGGDLSRRYTGPSEAAVAMLRGEEPMISDPSILRHPSNEPWLSDVRVRMLTHKQLIERGGPESWEEAQSMGFSISTEVPPVTSGDLDKDFYFLYAGRAGILGDPDEMNKRMRSRVESGVGQEIQKTWKNIEELPTSRVKAFENTIEKITRRSIGDTSRDSFDFEENKRWMGPGFNALMRGLAPLMEAGAAGLSADKRDELIRLSEQTITEIASPTYMLSQDASKLPKSAIRLIESLTRVYADTRGLFRPSTGEPGRIVSYVADAVRNFGQLGAELGASGETMAAAFLSPSSKGFAEIADLFEQGDINAGPIVAKLMGIAKESGAENIFRQVTDNSTLLSMQAAFAQRKAVERSPELESSLDNWERLNLEKGRALWLRNALLRQNAGKLTENIGVFMENEKELARLGLVPAQQEEDIADMLRRMGVTPGRAEGRAPGRMVESLRRNASGEVEKVERSPLPGIEPTAMGKVSGIVDLVDRIVMAGPDDVESAAGQLQGITEPDDIENEGLRARYKRQGEERGDAPSSERERTELDPVGYVKSLLEKGKFGGVDVKIRDQISGASGRRIHAIARNGEIEIDPIWAMQTYLDNAYNHPQVPGVEPVGRWLGSVKDSLDLTIVHEWWHLKGTRQDTAASNENMANVVGLLAIGIDPAELAEVYGKDVVEKAADLAERAASFLGTHKMPVTAPGGVSSLRDLQARFLDLTSRVDDFTKKGLATNKYGTTRVLPIDEERTRLMAYAGMKEDFTFGDQAEIDAIKDMLASAKAHGVPSSRTDIELAGRASEILTKAGPLATRLGGYDRAKRDLSASRALLERQAVGVEGANLAIPLAEMETSLGAEPEVVAKSRVALSTLLYNFGVEDIATARLNVETYKVGGRGIPTRADEVREARGIQKADQQRVDRKRAQEQQRGASLIGKMAIAGRFGTEEEMLDYAGAAGITDAGQIGMFQTIMEGKDLSAAQRRTAHGLGLSISAKAASAPTQLSNAELEKELSGVTQRLITTRKDVADAMSGSSKMEREAVEQMVAQTAQREARALTTQAYAGGGMGGAAGFMGSDAYSEFSRAMGGGGGGGGGPVSLGGAMFGLARKVASPFSTERAMMSRAWMYSGGKEVFEKFIPLAAEQDLATVRAAQSIGGYTQWESGIGYEMAERQADRTQSMTRAGRIGFQAYGLGATVPPGLQAVQAIAGPAIGRGAQAGLAAHFLGTALATTGGVTGALGAGLAGAAIPLGIAAGAAYGAYGFSNYATAQLSGDAESRLNISAQDTGIAAELKQLGTTPLRSGLSIFGKGMGIGMELLFSRMEGYGQFDIVGKEEERARISESGTALKSQDFASMTASEKSRVINLRAEELRESAPGFSGYTTAAISAATAEYAKYVPGFGQKNFGRPEFQRSVLKMLATNQGPEGFAGLARSLGDLRAEAPMELYQSFERMGLQGAQTEAMMYTVAQYAPLTQYGFSTANVMKLAEKGPLTGRAAAQFQQMLQQDPRILSKAVMGQIPSLSAFRGEVGIQTLDNMGLRLGTSGGLSSLVQSQQGNWRQMGLSGSIGTAAGGADIAASMGITGWSGESMWELEDMQTSMGIGANRFQRRQQRSEMRRAYGNISIAPPTMGEISSGRWNPQGLTSIDQVGGTFQQERQLNLQRTALQQATTRGGVAGGQDFVGQFGFQQRGLDLQQSQFTQDYELQGRQMYAQRDFSLTQRGWQGADMSTARSRGLTQRGWQSSDIDLNYGRSQTRFDWREQDMARTRENAVSSDAWQAWNLNWQQQTTQMQRGWQEEDWATTRSTTQLERGWGAEDLDEAIRFSTGRQRKQLLRQQERTTVRGNLQDASMDTAEDRAGQMWEMEDERFAMQKGRIEEEQEIRDDNWDTQLERLETQREWGDTDYDTTRMRFEEQSGWQNEDWEKETERFEKRSEYEDEFFALQERGYETRLEHFTESYQLQVDQFEENKVAYDKEIELATQLRLLNEKNDLARINTMTAEVAMSETIAQGTEGFNRATRMFSRMTEAQQAGVFDRFIDVLDGIARSGAGTASQGYTGFGEP